MSQRVLAPPASGLHREGSIRPPRRFPASPVGPGVSRVAVAAAARRIRSLLLPALMLLVAAGCGHAPRQASPPEPPQDIAGAGLLPEVDDAPVADAAYVSAREVLVRYRIGDHVVHASAARPSTAARVPVALLEAMDEPGWTRRTAQMKLVPVQGPGAWRRFLERMRATITSTDPGQGTLVDVLQERDLFHYYDAFGTLRTVPFEYKPADVRVGATYRLDRLLRLAPAEILAPAPGEAGQRLGVVSTGDGAQGGYPFVLLDAGGAEVLFLRDVSGGSSRDGFAGHATLAATHALVSQLRGLLEQPVTSLARLFTLVSTTTFDLVDPRQLFPLAAGPVPAVTDRPDMDTGAWERELDRITGEKATAGKIRYLVDGEQFFPRLVDAVSAARSSVHMRIYIFDNDDVALRFAELLKRRSREIDVKVLVDGLGTLGAAAAEPDYAPRAGDHPRSPLAVLTEGSRVQLRVVANPWFAGDHTKSIVVDERTAFVGGMNIGREYRYEWHDLMVELTGPVVDRLRTDFGKTWAQQVPLGDLRRWLVRVPPANAAAPGDHPLRVLVTGNQNPQILQAQLAAIRRAQRRIYIQNAYFTSDAILYELAAARRRGVDVRVIIPYRNDSGLIRRSNAVAANVMLAHGIRVYIYPGMSHVKGAIYDGWACLGSANFDTLSLAVNRELNVATSHPPAVEAFVQRVFEPDFARSVELTRPFPRQWSDFLSELLADRL